MSVCHLCLPLNGSTGFHEILWNGLDSQLLDPVGEVLLKQSNSMIYDHKK